MKKVKAFTLIEIVITMLLTALLFLFAFTAIQIFQRHFKSRRDNSASFQEVYFFKEYFQRDLKLSKCVIRLKEELVQLNMPDSTNILYTFSDTLIIREAKGEQVNFRIKGPKLSCEYLPRYNKVIKTLHLRFLLVSADEMLFFEKQYTASDYLNQMGQVDE